MSCFSTYVSAGSADADADAVGVDGTTGGVAGWAAGAGGAGFRAVVQPVVDERRPGDEQPQDGGHGGGNRQRVLPATGGTGAFRLVHVGHSHPFRNVDGRRSSP
jgi:hypothetical protein